ncbi:hypothetical protein DFQ14_10276 [Halopolyspora algeriensis]|uniref:Sugar phosphate isomerase n=1 Tax=Halopolyspora algeriensis TaxID=1500506 RepID=A0A368VV54_9ACTN|nr:EboA domain-containing protein [Halopolyspora algeriensis]RCW45775.1 hypothetical protein DFQ14_10276 [Halopolyspora algeriensis]TQM54159.1 hypothetical protein FHU43_2338 [Halopolyspora algeriensis]
MTRKTSPDELHVLLGTRLTGEGEQWLTAALDRTRQDRAAIGALFPAAGRRCGRGPLLDVESSRPPDPRFRGWTVDDAARTLMMAALPLHGTDLGDEVAALYRYGDAAEKRGVLRGLGPLDTDGKLGDHALPLVHDGLRTNDTRLITAALASYGARYLQPAAYRQGVLKCVFLGIPLADIAGLDERADAELARMLTDYARERRAAGRDVPADVLGLVDPTDITLSREA